MGRRAVVRTARTTLLACLLLMAVGGAVNPAGAQTGTGDDGSIDLVPERIVGGPGHAGLYGWGAATMRDGTVIISDYWNMRVVRYAPDGTSLGVFIENPGYGPDQHQAPYGLAVDPDNGDVYVADTDRRQIDRYDETGSFLNSLGQNGVSGVGPGQFRYPSRVAVRNGVVYVADTWPHRIVAYRPDGTELWSAGGFGSGLGQLRQPRALTFGPTGVLYVADHGNSRVQAFWPTSTGLDPLFAFGSAFDPAATDPAPDAVIRGDLRGLVAHPVTGDVYLVDGEGNRIHRFAADGTYIDTFGRAGTGLGEFSDGGREITVAGDGRLWVGDMPNFRVQVFEPDGTPVFARPDPPEPPPLGGFNTPRGVAVDASGRIFVGDTYNWRIQRLSADGQPELAWGSRGRGLNRFNYTRMLAVDRATSDVVVADTDNHRISRYSADGQLRWSAGGAGRALGQFANPHGVDVDAAGNIVVADTNNDRIQVLSPEGVALSTFGGPGPGIDQFAFPRGVAVGPDGNYFVSDSVRDRVMEFSPDGTWVRNFGPSAGADALQAPFDVEVLDDWVIVADTLSNDLKVYRRDGTFEATFSGWGTGLGRVRSPSGLDVLGDRLYVAERDNERVQVFRIAQGAPPEPDVVAPSTTLDVPGAFDELSGPAVTLSGTTTDDRRVGQVEVAVKDRDTGLWWNGSGWGSFQWLPATVADPTQTSSSWALDLDASASSGDLWTTVRSTDLAGNVEASRPSARFTVTLSGEDPDVTAPDTTLGVPDGAETLDGPAVVLTGAATDDRAVNAVEIAVKDRVTGQWWRGDGWGSFTWVDAAVEPSGASQVKWSAPLDASGTSGDLWMVARSTDAAGNTDQTPVATRFAVADEPGVEPDTTAPDTSLAVPTPFEELSGPVVAVSGTATDDRGLAMVQVSVRDRQTGQWWQGSSWGPGFTWVTAPVADPGASSSTWALDIDTTGTSGDSWMQVRAVDDVGNTDASPASARFSVG